MDEQSQKTIMVVDDTESNLDMVLSILQEYDVIPSTSGADALEMLKEEAVDLLLLDILMPEMDGYTVCQVLKADPALQHIPVIFITAKTDEESIEKAYELGGADYVTKPFKPKELMARVRVQLRLQDYINRLDYMATRDTLTGIYNRRKFFDEGEAVFQASAGDLHAFMLDIDHFKQINDTYGHQIGDVTLKKITEVVSETLPDDTLFGRLGGEEFGVLLVHESPEHALSVARDILQAVSQTVIPDNAGGTFSCTVSIGASKKRDVTPQLDILLKEADLALYEAKEGGRNRVIRNRNI